MKARITYDCDGTKHMDLEAEGISAQLWEGGRALVEESSGGRVVRSVHFERAHLIDIVREGVPK